MSGDLITFGKHKGRPVEALAEDRQYADWLVQQPWFRERHPKIYNVVINNFCEPSNTPDHNAIQARFLDEDYRLKFLSIAIPRLWWFCQPNGEMAEIATKWAVDNASDDACLRLDCFIDDEPVKPGLKPGTLVRDVPEFSQTRKSSLLDVSEPVFESKGADVKIRVRAGFGWSVRRRLAYKTEPSTEIGLSKVVAVEIKPSVGDDYPQILRQMRRNGSKFLLTQNYHGEGVDEPTFIRFMESQGLKIIFEREIFAAEKFSVEKFDQEKFLATLAEKISAQKSQYSP